MKKILLLLLSGFLYSNIVHAEYEEMYSHKGKSAIFRLNMVYVDEILEDGDNGAGPTAEISFLLSGVDGIYHTIGFESGYIISDTSDSSGVQTETYLVPIFFNYTMGSNIGESGFFWEAGFGLGSVYANVDLDFKPDPNDASANFSEKDEDFVFGGQVFGSVGYGFSERAGVLLGARYIAANDGDLTFGDIELDGEIINTVAIDFSLNYTF